MGSKSKEEKTRQIQDILRLYLIEKCTYKEITEKIGVSRPTARKYIDKFKQLASKEDFAIKDYYRDLKRRVPFPTNWNKYVKMIIDDYARHPKTVATPGMRKKIINAATPDNPIDGLKNAMQTYKKLQNSKDKIPSYETVAKVLREYIKKT